MTYETVADVLVAAGWDVGRGGRTRCPIHRGDNPTAFSYQRDRWFCHAGCGGGGIKSLAERLGLAASPPPPPPGLKAPVPGGVLGMHFSVEQRQPPRVSERLADEWKWRVRIHRQMVEERHRIALALLHEVDERLKAVAEACPPAQPWTTEIEDHWNDLGYTWTEAMHQLRCTHAEMVVLAWAARLDPQLVFEPCPGDCYRRGENPIDDTVVTSVMAWVAKQDEAFRGMVEKFLASPPEIR